MRICLAGVEVKEAGVNGSMPKLSGSSEATAGFHSRPAGGLY